jgi:pantetheine-phosphate adenylyltransferase
MQRIAVYPGTFDPITNGHLDILKRSAKIFDKVIVLVAERSEKSTMFSLEERIDVIKKVIKKIKNVSVEPLQDELLSDFLLRRGIHFVVRGLRAVSDFDYELQMVLLNRELNPEMETVFIMGGKETIFLSSSIVREIALNKGDTSKFVPNEVLAMIKKKIGD